MPTPASESPDAFGSPVPAQRVCELASYVSVPIAFVPKSPERNFHGEPGSRALSFRQTPPPAAAIQSLHDERSQGPSAIAVTRPDTGKSLDWKSKKFSTEGCVDVVGPISFQPPFCAAER